MKNPPRLGPELSHLARLPVRLLLLLRWRNHLRLGNIGPRQPGMKSELRPAHQSGGCVGRLEEEDTLTLGAGQANIGPVQGAPL